MTSQNPYIYTYTDAKELQRFFKTNYKKVALSDGEVQAMMDDADTDSDGFIDFEEFSQLLERFKNNKMAYGKTAGNWDILLNDLMIRRPSPIRKRTERLRRRTSSGADSLEQQPQPVSLELAEQALGAGTNMCIFDTSICPLIDVIVRTANPTNNPAVPKEEQSDEFCWCFHRRTRPVGGGA